MTYRSITDTSIAFFALAIGTVVLYPLYLLSRLVRLVVPVGLTCSILCISLNTFWKYSAAPFPKDPTVVSSTVSPIGSPKSFQKHENSAKGGVSVAIFRARVAAPSAIMASGQHRDRLMRAKFW